MDKNKSFTLIELIIVVVIIALFSGLLLANYNNFAQEKKLETEANKLVAVLELAKKKANAGDRTAVIGSCLGDLTGYRVRLDNVSRGSSKYTLRMICSENPTNPPLATYILPTDFEISKTDPSIPDRIIYFHFNTLNSGVTTNNDDPLVNQIFSIWLKNDTLGKCQKISVDEITELITVEKNDTCT